MAAPPAPNSHAERSGSSSVVCWRPVGSESVDCGIGDQIQFFFEKSSPKFLKNENVVFLTFWNILSVRYVCCIFDLEKSKICRKSKIFFIVNVGLIMPVRSRSAVNISGHVLTKTNWHQRKTKLMLTLFVKSIDIWSQLPEVTHVSKGLCIVGSLM